MAALRAARLAARAATLRPEALLTVTDGYSWMAAAEVAKRLSVPLHLICHDEWARAGIASRWKDRVFGRLYRAAASRLCVSPSMAREYQRRYQAKGTVLYPSRAQNAPSFPISSNRVRIESHPFTCAFAGTINTSGVVDALKALASSLETLGGHLLIFGPLDASQARSAGLELPNIELGGLLPSEELMKVLRERADCLFVPMSFTLEDRLRIQVGFPSKLTDYTALRMPILLYGPPECSAAVWGRDNPGTLLAVHTEDRMVLSSALARLARDANLRISLSKTAGLVGDRDFSYAAAMTIFMSALKVGQADYRVSD
jgi:glycosyltransferase involved in cell wall biosynthesis